MSRIQHVFGKALAGAALALSVALPLGAAATGLPRDVIYNFMRGPDGALPLAGLIRDAAGNFYGTTADGGNPDGAGFGVVFKLSPLGVETPLYTFTGGSDGSNPEGKLVSDAAGNLYGTTLGGGAHGPGVVFKVTPGGVETVLYSFGAGPNDGAQPASGLVMDRAGNLYGTTHIGGPLEDGTVFKLAPDGTETVLHTFTGEGDGSDPTGDLVMDKNGALYGTTFSCCTGSSTIFKIAANGDYSVLHTFRYGDAGGDCVHGGVIVDRDGALYGTTTPSCSSAPVVFKIMPNGKETVLHTFTGLEGVGSYASLIMDRQGNLFGTSYGGGRFNHGTVFKISPDGTATVLHSFAHTRDDPPDGGQPWGSLILYMNKLYGTTFHGGHRSHFLCRKGCGTVFEVKKGK